MFRFEKLDVWHRAIEFADVVYEVTKSIPSDERFGLTSQLRRASVSVSSNIAEGSGRVADKEFAHFLAMAYGSTLEVVSQCAIAQRQIWISVDDYNRIYSLASEIARMLSGLRSKLLSGS